MSTIPITTYCQCKVKDGHYDGDREQIVCNRCDLVIEGSERFTMAEIAEYNEDYKRRYLKASKDIAEIEAMFSSDYQEPTVAEINAKHERQRDSQIDNIY